MAPAATAAMVWCAARRLWRHPRSGHKHVVGQVIEGAYEVLGVFDRIEQERSDAGRSRCRANQSAYARAAPTGYMAKIIIPLPRRSAERPPLE